MPKPVLKPMKTVSFNGDLLIAGAFFAARNAWELLQDARMLHNAGRFASAFGLAVFCREEVGKSNIWREQWERCISGQCVTMDDLKRGGATNHRKKLARVGKHLSEGTLRQLGPFGRAEEEVNWAKKISEMNVQVRERDPERTHLWRLRAFFVEFGGSELRPVIGQPRQLFDAAKASSQLLEAEEAYDRVRGELMALQEKSMLNQYGPGLFARN